MAANYNKPVLTLDQQINLLESRGLSIPDRNKARHYLQFINYYRFSGYTISFEQVINGKRNHQFKPGATFDNILNLYNFDRHLRMLVMDAIERIEVAVRTQICYVLATTYNDSHWHLRRDLFHPAFKYYMLLSKCEMEQFRSKEPFALHYKKTYDLPALLAGWMMTELLSMGTWSQMYENLINRSDRKQISDAFKLPSMEFESWLHSLTYIRNLCAHHSRLWNRQFTITPKQLKNYRKYFAPNTTFAAQAAMIHLLLNVISPDSAWTTQLFNLIKNHSFINPTRMGFTTDWQDDKFWGIKFK
jgi:abortive infection bacteriophage resistance protein